MASRTASPARILVVEDDRELCDLLVEELHDRGYVTRGAGRSEEALRILTEDEFDLVLSDVRLPDMPGTNLLSRIRELANPPACILITAFGTVPQAVEALKMGADDFLTKPVDLEHLDLRIERTLAARRMQEEMHRLRHGLGEDDSFHGLFGTSPTMRRLFRQVLGVARTDGEVLVVGESGTGKDLVARAIHAESPRSAGPFVPVNCASVPAELLESEFFGHAAGAFTGARTSRQGLFAAAEGGTLFLDEVAEMPLALQAKLLRVIEDHRVRPVGADDEQAVDVRIVAATNRNPEDAVADGTLREDLFYRLEALSLQVPPLRERGDDLDLLAGRFLARIRARHGKHDLLLSEEVVEYLRAYRFPGNVRELLNVIERAVTFADGERILPGHLPRRLRQGSPGRGDADVGLPAGATMQQWPTLHQVEQRYIRRVLEQVGGNKREASRILGIGRRTLYRRLEQPGDGTGDA